MIVYKLFRVLLHLCVGLLACALIFPRLNIAGRQRRIRQWSDKLLGICGVQVNVINKADTPDGLPTLRVANHISWLDIFVINSLHPSCFVAKSDIREWLLLGWLCDKAGTVFISRGKIRDVRRIYEGLVSTIHAGEHVAFFPEGTTAAQGILLPFHANLFEAAIDAKVPIQPYALRYINAKGELHSAVNFIDDTSFAQSILTILQAQKIIVELILLPLIHTNSESHRRELARAARHSIAKALGHPHP